MLPIRTILHATDFSIQSRTALGLARSLARDHGARLVLLHVAPNPVDEGMLASVPMDRRYYYEALEELRAPLDGPDLKFPIEVHLRFGDPAEEILQEAEELSCDLIVLGTHGRTGLSRLLMGSVAETVMRQATIPVLTAKPAAPRLEPVPAGST